MRSDSTFSSGIIGAAKAQAQTSKAPVFLYRISIDDELNKTGGPMGGKKSPAKGKLKIRHHIFCIENYLGYSSIASSIAKLCFVCLINNL